MNRDDLLRIYYFGGGAPSFQNPNTHKETVTKWSRYDEGGTFRTVTARPSDLTGWEEYKELVDVENPAADSAATKAASEDAARKEADLARKRKGRMASILTSGQGVPGSPKVNQPTLLGTKKLTGE